MPAADPTQRMILILGGMMGLRRSDIAGLRDGDIDGNRMVIRGKGHGRDGLVSVMEMPPPVTRELDRYFRWREPYPQGRRTCGAAPVRHLRGAARHFPQIRQRLRQEARAQGGDQGHIPLPQEDVRHRPLLRVRLRLGDAEGPAPPRQHKHHLQMLHRKLREEEERGGGRAFRTDGRARCARHPH